MYITYETVPNYWSEKNVMPRKTIPNDLPKPDFMPAKLVRISDMKVVSGSQVNEGYCALSYSWNQSGDILYDEIAGKYKRIDKGKHRIFRSDYHYEYVKFEGIIQQICQQFNIKYIWYDQLCINQDNKKEKQREIRKMHRLYENAYCTVALVPDFSRERTLHTSEQQYIKRLWTLEEAIMSKKLLYVGRNRYEYGDGTIGKDDIDHLTKSSSELKVSQILYHAHQRTSTNNHDRVFALIHLFPEFIDHKDEPQSSKKLIIRRFGGFFSNKNSINKIRIDYNQPYEDLMIQFYGLLAKKDLSVLFFGNYKRNYESTIKKYKFLPSWTGVNGQHSPRDMTIPFRNYDIIGKTMHVTTTYVTNNQSIGYGTFTLREEDIPPIPEYINDGDNEEYYDLCILVQLSETNEMKRIILNYYIHISEFAEISFFDIMSKDLQQLSRFMEIKKENLYWCNRESDDYRKTARIKFDDLTDNLDDPSAQYVILSEISIEIDIIFFHKHFFIP